MAEPSRDLRLSLQEASRSLAVALDFLVVHGEPAAAASARAIQAKHAHIVPDLQRMLAAIDAGDRALATAIHERPVHPAYATLQHKISAFADREQQEVTGSWARCGSASTTCGWPASPQPGWERSRWVCSCHWSLATSGGLSVRRCRTR